LSPFILMYIIL